MPARSAVVSTFPVGPLPAGAYTVVANLNLTGAPPLACGPPQTVTQTGAFVVNAVVVPALDSTGLVTLLVLLGAIAALRMRG